MLLPVGVADSSWSMMQGAVVSCFLDLHTIYGKVKGSLSISASGRAAH